MKSGRSPTVGQGEGHSPQGECGLKLLEANHGEVIA